MVKYEGLKFTASAISSAEILRFISVSYTHLYFISGMSSIPEEIYESSRIDGANGVQTFFHITLPMLSPVLKVILMLAITTAFKDYQSILVLTDGGPNNRSHVMFSYIYKLIFSSSLSLIHIYGRLSLIRPAFILRAADSPMIQ